MSEEKEVASPSQYRRVWEIHQMLIPKPDDLISTHRFFVRYILFQLALSNSM